MTIKDPKQLTIFELTGTDVLEFLNNQTISELKEHNEAVVYTAICNPKGRIIFTLFLQTNTDKTWITVDTSLSDVFLQYINLRRFRMNVLIKQTDQQLKLSNQPEQNYGLTLSTQHGPQTPELSQEAFWCHMFDLKLPWINTQTTEQFIPQHLNLDQNSIIDFDKGCYPGQEIIARLHYLGNVKKRMQTITYVADEAYQPGQTITLDNSSSKAELCSPSVLIQNQWHAQAILAV